MVDGQPGRGRSYAPVVIGVALLVTAATLLAVVALTRHRTVASHPLEDAVAACRAFEPVYDASRSTASFDGNALAGSLGRAIDDMHRAASADRRWRSLASALDRLGRAVNAGDTATSAATIDDVHGECEAVLGRSASTA